jgi:hypothetical protein
LITEQSRGGPPRADAKPSEFFDTSMLPLFEFKPFEFEPFLPDHGIPRGREARKTMIASRRSLIVPISLLVDGILIQKAFNSLGSCFRILNVASASF